MALFQVAVCTLALLVFVQISSGCGGCNSCNSCGVYSSCCPRYVNDFCCYCCKPLFINCKGQGQGYGYVDAYNSRDAVNRSFKDQSTDDEKPNFEPEKTEDIEESVINENIAEPVVNETVNNFAVGSSLGTAVDNTVGDEIGAVDGLFGQ